MTNPAQEQSSQARSDDASFQEGVSNGFHEGRSQNSLPPHEHEPARVEAFMNSKRDEAVSNSRPGYDSGFVAAENSDNRRHSHAELFPGSADQLDASISRPMTQDSTRVAPQTSSLFSIPRNGSETTNPQDSLGANEDGASISPSTSEINSHAPSSFDNAGAVLDSVIKMNAEPVTPIEESVTTEAAPGLSQPTAPESPELKSESDATPDRSRSIIELPLDDDDVANGSGPQNARPNTYVLESATISTSPAMNGEAISATVAVSHLKFGQIPHAYLGRLLFGHTVTNPHVSSAEPAPESQKILDHPQTGAGQPSSHNNIAPKQVATFVQTSRGANSTTVPIANEAPDSPSIQVRHEAKAINLTPPSAPNYKPKASFLPR